MCPASYELGEDLRLVLFSVTEGEDKPLKYPTICNTADVAVIAKAGRAAAAEFHREAARRSVQAGRPGMATLELSAKTGEGMQELLSLLLSRHAARTIETVNGLYPNNS